MPSSAVFRLFVALHVTANVVWIGALLSVALILSRAAAAPPGGVPAADLGQLARTVHVRLAVPAFITSFAAGVANIAQAPVAYAHLPWFHAKLTFALVVIALHHVLGARARRVGGGDVAAARGAGVLAAVVFGCATITVFLGVLKGLP